MLHGPLLSPLSHAHAFRFADAHAWAKPSDDRALRLADRAAQEVAVTVLGGECVLGYGQSDEFSFVLRRGTSLFGRRASKLATVAASTFSAAYTRFWPSFFPGTPLAATPAFDGRAVAYPAAANLRHYLAWRQVDCHVNCQYNACFWALVGRGGVGRAEAAASLKVCVRGRGNGVAARPRPSTQPHTSSRLSLQTLFLLHSGHPDRRQERAPLLPVRHQLRPPARPPPERVRPGAGGGRGGGRGRG